ncbi:unnamed protein product [Somion occarium]|uniref:Uncharacterized protein n=1 Tax=Somion occarium TaxID=3059160 RepID=A0ABP1DRU6_9APHY
MAFQQAPPDTYFLYAEIDDKPTYEALASLQIPILTIILHNLRELLLNNKTIRLAYIRSLAISSTSNETSAEMDPIIRALFRDDGPKEIGLMELDDIFAVTYRFCDKYPRLFISWKLGLALSQISANILCSLTREDRNLIVLVGVILHHEMAHYIRGVELGSTPTPSGIVYPRKISQISEDYFSNNYAEAGLDVEGKLFGGLLHPIYRLDREDDYSFIDGFYFIKELCGVYYDLTAFVVNTSYITRLADTWLGNTPVHLASLEVDVLRDASEVKLVIRPPHQHGPDVSTKGSGGQLWFRWGEMEIPAIEVCSIEEHMACKCITRDVP